jgi:hypothetical protein
MLGCPSGPNIKLCGEIPMGGCPIGRGGTCMDATCDALYDCVDGSWTLAEQCDQGVGGGGTSSSSLSSSSTGLCMPGTFDHANEAMGCTPDLESPDCPVEAAESCEPCATGCVDFFMCKTSGWMDVAFCDDTGKLVLVGQ